MEAVTNRLQTCSMSPSSSRVAKSNPGRSSPWIGRIAAMSLKILMPSSFARMSPIMALESTKIFTRFWYIPLKSDRPGRAKAEKRFTFTSVPSGIRTVTKGAWYWVVIVLLGAKNYGHGGACGARSGWDSGDSGRRYTQDTVSTVWVMSKKLQVPAAAFTFMTMSTLSAPKSIAAFAGFGSQL